MSKSKCNIKLPEKLMDNPLACNSLSKGYLRKVEANEQRHHISSILPTLLSQMLYSKLSSLMDNS